MLPLVASQAVSVSSITLDTPRSLDGLSLDASGRLVGAAGFDGSQLFWINTDGSTEVLASGISGPVDLDVDAAGYLYTTAFMGDQLIRVDPATGESEFWGWTQAGPSGITIDAVSGTAYVSHFGSGDQGNGNTVLAINLETKDVSTFAFGRGLHVPVSITQDDAGNLYTTNLLDGNVHRITPNQEVSLLATLPIASLGAYNIGHVTFANGALYATSLSLHAIYRISLSGEVEHIAGTGTAGTADGMGREAQFRSPNGITASVTGDSLFVAELSNPSTVRVIALQAATTIADKPTLPRTLELRNLYPNPIASGQAVQVMVPAVAPTPLPAELHVVDTLGRTVYQVSSLHLTSGFQRVPINLPPLPSGLYFIRLTTENTVKSTTLVVNGSS